MLFSNQLYLNQYLNQGSFMNMYNMNGFGCSTEYTTGQMFGSIFSNLTGVLTTSLITKAAGGQRVTAQVHSENLDNLETKLDNLNAQKKNAIEVKNNPEKKLDKSLFETEIELKSAHDNVTKADTKYNNAKTATSNAKQNVEKAQTKLNTVNNNENKQEFEEAKKALEEAKKTLEEATIAENTALKELNQAKSDEKNAIKNNQKAQENIAKIKEAAEKEIEKLDNEIEKTKAKIEKAKTQVLSDERISAKHNSGHVSKEDLESLFDSNGNFVYSSNIKYKDAANKQLSIFLKEQTPENAKRFLKLYDQCDSDEQNEFAQVAVEQAKKVSKQTKPEE